MDLPFIEDYDILFDDDGAEGQVEPPLASLPKQNDPEYKTASKLLKQKVKKITKEGKDGGGNRYSLDLCRHSIHISCFDKYSKEIKRHKEKNDISFNEFQCPLCRSLSNIILPNIPPLSNLPSDSLLATKIFNHFPLFTNRLYSIYLFPLSPPSLSSTSPFFHSSLYFILISLVCAFPFPLPLFLLLFPFSFSSSLFLFPFSSSLFPLPSSSFLSPFSSSLFPLPLSSSPFPFPLPLSSSPFPSPLPFSFSSSPSSFISVVRRCISL